MTSRYRPVQTRDADEGQPAPDHHGRRPRCGQAQRSSTSTVMAWTVRQPSSRVPPRRVTGPAVGPNLNRGDADHRPQVDRRSNTRRRDASGGAGGRGVRARRKPPDRGKHHEPRRDASRATMSCPTRFAAEGAGGYRRRTSMTVRGARRGAASRARSPTPGSPACSSAMRAALAAARRMCPTWLARASGCRYAADAASPAARAASRASHGEQLVHRQLEITRVRHQTIVPRTIRSQDAQASQRRRSLPAGTPRVRSETSRGRRRCGRRPRRCPP